MMSDIILEEKLIFFIPLNNLCLNNKLKTERLTAILHAVLQRIPAWLPRLGLVRSLSPVFHIFIYHMKQDDI